MERNEAVITLEEELHAACWSAKKASYVLQEIFDSFFCYADAAISQPAFEHLRSEYGRACAKADIARCLTNETIHILEELLQSDV